MRVIMQRAARGAVTWSDDSGRRHGNQIGHGLVILVGAGPDDTEPQVDRLADKVAQLRIFADGAGRFNRSLEDVGGEALVVSQFTLYADTSRGRRPGFVRAGDPARAKALYERFAARLGERGITVRSGSFGAHMTVSLDNDGPVTIALSTDQWDTQI